MGKLCFRFFVLFLIFDSIVYADDLSITLPVADTAIAACDDYFTTKWGEPLDMLSGGRHGDILDNFPSEVSDVGSVTYSGGVASIPATGNTPYVRVLTPANFAQVIDTNVTRYGQIFEVDPSVYSVLSMRMKSGSTSSSGYSYRWDTCPTASVGYTSSFTALTGIPAGWSIFSKDLSGITPSLGSNLWNNGNKCGLSIYPTRNVSGVTSEIDWVQLTKPASQCSSATVGFTSSSSIPYRIFLDSDGSLVNGGDVGSDILTGPGASTVNFSSSYLFPGTYNIRGIQSNDLATLHLNPWDFSEENDIAQGQGSGITFQNGNGIVNGKLCGTTTNSDPGFFLKFPEGMTADSSKYKYINLNVTQSTGNQFELIFYNQSGPVGLRRFNVPSGTNTVTRDLSTLLFAEAGDYTGQITGIRIDPGAEAGHDFCIDWVSLGSDTVASEPSIASATISATGTVTVNPRSVVRLAQPDKRGDKDYFIDSKNNQLNFNSTQDIVLAQNMKKADIYPAGSFVDNAGHTVYGDFLRIESIGDGSGAAGDSQLFLRYDERNQPINANIYKIVCYDLHHLNLPRDSFQSMVRFIWDKPSGGFYGGDDVFTGVEDSETRRLRGKETDVCVDLSTMPLELDDASTLYGDFWKDTVTFLRLDPHEESINITSILKEMRLSSYHTTDSKFAIVAQGSRDSNVNIYYSTSKGAISGGTIITTLSSGRNSDVHLWNTAAIAEGTYYLYASVGGNSYAADGPVVIDRSSGRGSDIESPILSLFTPSADGSSRFSTLDLAGYALDNRRISSIEVFIDNQIVHTFVPYKFHKETRDAYPSYPFASLSGFQESISLEGLSDGVKTLRVDVWDTHGNSTSVTRSFTKASSTLSSPYEWPTYNDASEPISIIAPTPTPTPTATPAPSLSASLGLSIKAVKPSGIKVDVSNGGSCSMVQLQSAATSSGAASGKVIAKGAMKGGKKTFSSKEILKLDPKAKGSSKVHLRAECSSDSAIFSEVKNFDAKKYGKKIEKKLSKVISKLKLK